MDKITAYKMTKTMDMANIKDIAGSTVKVDSIQRNTYVAADGTEHCVLAVLLDNGAMYRTETRAFIEDIENFMNVFDDPAERPSIKIAIVRSKRGNDLVKFTIV